MEPEDGEDSSESDEDKRSQKEDGLSSKSELLRLGWKDYVAIFIASLQTILLPLVVIVLILLLLIFILPLTLR